MEGPNTSSRRTEAGHQVFEVTGIVKRQLEPAGDQALGVPGGPSRKTLSRRWGRQRAEPQGRPGAHWQPLPGRPGAVAGAHGWGGTNSILG